MSILDNLDNDLYPMFESESSSGVIQNFSDSCSNGCGCRGYTGHGTEFIQDTIDFDQ